MLQPPIEMDARPLREIPQGSRSAVSGEFVSVLDQCGCHRRDLASSDRNGLRQSDREMISFITSFVPA